MTFPSGPSVAALSRFDEEPRLSMRRPWFLGALTLMILLLLGACASPVTVEPVSARSAYSRLNRAALTDNSPSEATLIVLRREALLDNYSQSPVQGLAALHASLAAEGGPADTLFALAELHYLRGRQEESRADHFASALFAFAFLFPEDAAQRPNPYDPRFRQASDLYNLALSAALALPDGTGASLRGGRFELPFGTLDVALDDSALQLDQREVVSYVSTIRLDVSGFQNVYRSAGLGAPMAASLRRSHPPGQVLEVAPNLRVPSSALLDVPDARRQVAGHAVRARLKVFSIFDTSTVQIAGQRVPLEYNQTAASAFSLQQARPWRNELRGFLLGDLLDRGDTARLVALQPRRPGRIPVVLVHGTASSAFRWADMVNDLFEDPRLRDHFEFWFFSYATGNPIPYSALLLRQSLEGAVRQLGGERTDPALGQMVVMGHSQGGLLTKLLVVDAGSRLWDEVSTTPLDQLRLRPASRELARQAMFPQPLPQVRRVVFVATPHHGSYVSGWSVAQLAGRLVALPASLLALSADMLTNNATGLAVDQKVPRLGSVYGMTPRSPLIRGLSALPIGPGVHAHSIIPTLGDGPLAERTDGVVAYSSAHVEGVASEFVVERSGHSTQADPRTISEVRRILLLHLATICAEGRCPPGIAATVAAR